MTSESSSAVVELNDADGEDTECGSVNDDAEGAPLIMEHGADIAVKVDAPMKQLSTLETFVTYRVRCVCARWPTPPHVRRRYNHFKVLHKRLVSAHPLIAPPPLPPLHSARQQLDRYSPSFVAVRTIALNIFLDRVAKHPLLTHSEDFRIFLTTPDDEIDKVFKSENSALNLWGLSTALYSGGSGESKPANGVRVKDPEFSSAADYLQSLQHKLTTLCSLTTKLYKGSAALGTEYMSMKRVCDAWATQAGGATSRALSALGHGALTRAHAHANAQTRNAGAHRARAMLPMLALYAAAHQEKIRQRDAIHAAHVAGNNTDELHNRLEQASEALRSELQDWTPKTRTDIKSLLLEIANHQVAIHTQALHGWEHALKLSTQNIEDLFKTVSKTAVQNLSPSKSRDLPTPNETERDLDDIDVYSESDQDLRFDNQDTLRYDGQDMDKIQDSGPFNVGNIPHDTSVEVHEIRFKIEQGNLCDSVGQVGNDFDQVGNTSAKVSDEGLKDLSQVGSDFDQMGNTSVKVSDESVKDLSQMGNDFEQHKTVTVSSKDSFEHVSGDSNVASDFKGEIDENKVDNSLKNEGLSELGSNSSKQEVSLSEMGNSSQKNGDLSETGNSFEQVGNVDVQNGAPKKIFSDPLSDFAEVDLSS